MTDNNMISESADYIGEDGLLYCGKCHERKQKKITFPALPSIGMDGQERIVHIMCLCDRREEEERRKREHVERVDRMRSICFTDRTMYNWTLDKADKLSEDVRFICQTFIDEWADNCRTNTGLLFWGGVGNGKSTAAACIANALLEQEVSVLMRNTSAFLNGPFEDRDELIRDASRYGLLIIDDFGMERSTDYGMEMMFSLIDTRCNSGKPTIITTNLPLDVILNPQDLAHERIYDRIYGMCAPVKFEGESLRPGIQMQKLDHFKELLQKRKEAANE